MKKFISILLLIFTVFMAVSCTAVNGTSGTVDKNGSTEPKVTDGLWSKSYRDDIDCDALVVNAENKIALGAGLELMNKGEISISVQTYLCDAVEAANNYVIRFTGGSSFDEFGILRYDDEKTAATNASLVKDYLKSLQEDSLYRSYFPDEEYKLDEWEVKTFGNYVVYAVLSAENRSAFFGEVEQLLVKV